MARAHETGPFEARGLDLVQSIGKPGLAAQMGDVDQPFGSGGINLSGCREPFQPDPGGHAMNPVQYLGQKLPGDRTGHAEHAIAAGRVKRLRQGQDTLDAAQNGGDILDQGQGEGAWLHPPANLDQKRVANLIAQPASAWLIADGVLPSFPAAPATLPSTISASKTTSKFRSIRWS